MNKIEFSDISVIVQGPIIREPEYTKEVCMSIRRNLPGAEIILSTWERSDVYGLDYDVLIMNEDPGNFLYKLDRKLKNGNDIYPMNINRQIISTINGLKHAGRKYSCKLRSDTVITNTGFIDGFLAYNAPIGMPFRNLLKHRVVTLPAANPKRKIFGYTYCLSDWFYFGLTEDLLKIWDIPLIDTFYGEKKGGYYQMKCNLNNEQYAWLGFLKKVYPEMEDEVKESHKVGAIEDAEKSYANCCIFLTARKAGIKSLKFQYTGYGGSPVLSFAGLYTISEWKQMYRKYCAPGLFVPPDFLEQITYSFFQTLRKIRKICFKR